MVRLVNGENLSCVEKEKDRKLEEDKKTDEQRAIPRVRVTLPTTLLGMIIWCFEENLK